MSVNLLDQRIIIDSDGNPVGAELFFYFSGTTTKAPIFESADLVTPLANPVVVASGQPVPEIWLSDDIAYRRVIEYADGGSEDRDPLIVAEPSGGNGPAGLDRQDPIVSTGQTVFPLASALPAAIVTLDGLSQPVTSYIADFPNLTFSEEVPAGTVVDVYYGSTASGGDPGSFPTKEIPQGLYTLERVDTAQYLRFTAQGGCIVTLPENVFDVGDVLTLHTNAEETQIVLAPNVSANAPGGGVSPFSFFEQNATVQLKQYAANEWDLIGGIQGTI